MPIRVLWVFTPRCPHGVGGEGIAAHLTVTTQAFTCSMVISRELWDDFSRSVFTGEVTPGRGRRRGGRDEGGTRGQSCSCAARGAATSPALQAGQQDEALPTQLSSSGTALPPMPGGRPPGPWVTEHMRGACLNSGVL